MSSARSTSRTQGRLLASTTDRWSSGAEPVNGQLLQSLPACAVNRRVLRSTVWNSSSTPAATDSGRSITS